ncbi:hypothetical protein BBB56_23205 [Candidatus Pantoea deserta]|uniref:Uncharacterized protein n=1 Tax=Candidatus Pantoea deserta TaxID=1869313 RepID=A0A3N4N8M3_9GAMM|nr:hypothetical protein [Pantoea deserta]RPD91705.1 hypothetical protein BBB56_23205 [Pantoea deserta]
MNVSRAFQLLALVILCDAVVALSVWMKSWDMITKVIPAIFLFFIFLTLPALLKPLKNSSSSLVRTLRHLILPVWAAAILVFVLSFAERLVWVNAQSYPAWLAKVVYTDQSLDNPEVLMNIQDEQCSGIKGFRAIEMKNNGLFMRCDESLLPGSWWKGVYLLKHRPAHNPA